MTKSIYPVLYTISGFLFLCWGFCVINLGATSNWSLSLILLALSVSIFTLIIYLRDNSRHKNLTQNTAVKDLIQNVETGNRLLKTVFDNVPIAICVFDSELKVADWNQNYVSFTELDESQIHRGKSYEDLLRQHFIDYADEGESSDEFVARNADPANLKIPARYERRMKSGRILEVTRNPLPDGGFMACFTDVTSNRTAEILLKESEARYRKMVELSPDAILVHQQGFIIYANTAAISLIKINNLHNLIGRQVKEFFSHEQIHELAAHFGSADDLDVGQIIPSILADLLCEDGGVANISMEAAALLYGDKKVLQLILRDVTIQTQAQDILQSAKDKAEQADQIKSAFLANMSHELRTPLNAIIGFSEIISREIFGPAGSEKYVEYAEDIRASGTHLLDLINDILDYSKTETGLQNMHEEAVSLTETILGSLKIIRQKAVENDITISTDFADKNLVLNADAKMLKQIMINILSNAVKFTPPGGKIYISVSYGDNSNCCIIVRDTGIGIKEQDIAKAMTPFVQIDSELSKKFQGTGLGLPLSKDLVELHGGTLELKSSIGEGTSVIITLPASRITKSAA